MAFRRPTYIGRVIFTFIACLLALRIYTVSLPVTEGYKERADSHSGFYMLHLLNL